MAAFVLICSALHAQDMTGTWQGTLKAGPQELRIVLKISEDDKKLKAVSYSIDQGGAPIPATTVTQKRLSAENHVRFD